MTPRIENLWFTNATWAVNYTPYTYTNKQFWAVFITHCSQIYLSVRLYRAALYAHKRLSHTVSLIIRTDNWDLSMARRCERSYFPQHPQWARKVYWVAVGINPANKEIRPTVVDFRLPWPSTSEKCGHAADLWHEFTDIDSKWAKTPTTAIILIGKFFQLAINM